MAPSRHSSSGARLPGGAHCGTGGRPRSSTRSRPYRIERDLTLTDRAARISVEYERNFCHASIEEYFRGATHVFQLG